MTDSPTYQEADAYLAKEALHLPSSDFTRFPIAGPDQPPFNFDAFSRDEISRILKAMWYNPIELKPESAEARAARLERDPPRIAYLPTYQEADAFIAREALHLPPMAKEAQHLEEAAQEFDPAELITPVGHTTPPYPEGFFDDQVMGIDNTWYNIELDNLLGANTAEEWWNLPISDDESEINHLTRSGRCYQPELDQPQPQHDFMRNIEKG